jgi:sulfate transport system permease protein
MIAFRRPSVIPGFGPTLGFALVYLSLIVLIPLAGLFLRSSELGVEGFIRAVSTPRALAAFRLTFGASFLAAVVNAFFGLLVAWVMVRYRFPGRRVLDAFVDLPFALPTAVAGIALATLYAPNGWLGRWFDVVGIKIAFTQAGVFVALVFIGLPFVVRTIQPVLQDLEAELEEAAASLGATRWQTWRYVIFPVLLPPLLTGFALAFARAIGEYGSVIFIAGNLPLRTEIVPLLIFIQLEQYQYAAATAIAAVMLTISFVLLLLINLLQRWTAKRHTRD